MVKYFLKFSYIGTQYRGAQKQVADKFVRDTDSIQGALEAALLTLFPKTLTRPNVVLSSRTDVGVHALCNTAEVELVNKFNQVYYAGHVKQYVNRYFRKCGHTIRLLECIPVMPEFYARYSCKSRTYMYRFMIPKVSGEQRIPLLDAQHTYHLRAYNFDIDRARHGIQLFMGKKDFTTFSAKSVTNRKIVYVRSLDSFTLEEAQSLIPFDPLSENFRYWHFVVKARSFLYNQVRRMVGALIALGLGKITEKDITVMLQVPSHYNWHQAVTPVPPNGLHLMNLEYNLEELKRCTLPEPTKEEWEKKKYLEKQELILSQEKDENNLQSSQLQ